MGHRRPFADVPCHILIFKEKLVKNKHCGLYIQSNVFGESRDCYVIHYAHARVQKVNIIFTKDFFIRLSFYIVTTFELLPYLTFSLSAKQVTLLFSVNCYTIHLTQPLQLILLEKSTYPKAIESTVACCVRHYSL